MRAIEAKTFSGCGRPNCRSRDQGLVRVAANGVTPLDQTILSGGHPRAKAPLVLGNEGAGVVAASGDQRFPEGSRGMFTGPYGVLENGAFSEWIAGKPEHLCRVPETVGGAAAGMPVAYLTARIALRAAGVQPGGMVGGPESDHRCDEPDLEGCQHQKLLAIRASPIRLGRSLDDADGAS